jgi:hypothetical protein
MLFPVRVRLYAACRKIPPCGLMKSRTISKKNAGIDPFSPGYRCNCHARSVRLPMYETACSDAMPAAWEFLSISGQTPGMLRIAAKAICCEK